MRFALLVPIFCAFWFSSTLEAKVFNYKKDRFSSYLRAGFGLNKLQKNAFQPGFPTTGTTATSFPDHNGVNQDYDAEFGFGYRIQRITTRLGLGLVYPQVVTSEAGKNSAGTQTMSVTSQVYSLIPKLTFEFAGKETETFKVYVGGSIGYAITTLKNTVSLNAAGQAAFPTAGSEYIEEGSGYGLLGEVFTGIEFAFFDNVGFALDAGYRYLVTSSFNANRDANTVRGPITAGSTIKNVDGTNRTVDLSGAYLAGSFRIYLP